MTKHRPHVVEMSVTDEDVLGRDGVVEAGSGADVEDYALRTLLLPPPFAWLLFFGLATGRRDGRVVVARAETRSAGAAFVDGRTAIVMISEGGVVRRGGRVFRSR